MLIKQNHLRERKSFSKLPEFLELPYLIEAQKNSYSSFLQMDVPPEQRKEIGLQAAFKSAFPITVTSSKGETATLEFVDYSFGPVKYSPEECKDRGLTYSAPLKAKFRLILREFDKDSNEKIVKEVKEEEVFLGEIPLMTDNGSFIINGTERVVVSQLHRSPGVTFSEKISITGSKLYNARLIPVRGSWLEFDIDMNGLMYVSIDLRRKFYATTLLRAFGFTDDETLLKYVYPVKSIEIKEENTSSYLNKILAEDIVDKSTGELIAESTQKITPEIVEKIKTIGIHEIKILDVNYEKANLAFLNTLIKDPNKTEEAALLEIAQRIRPGTPPSAKSGKTLIENLFLNPKRYDLGRVGRYRLNKKLNLEIELEKRTLTGEDILGVVKYLSDLANGKGSVDDVDHLGNRRVRLVGELVENQVRLGLVVMERAIRERMILLGFENIMPHNLITPKPMITAVRDFFARSQLSQFMDETNPLAELTHKRRLSALGPGGLDRERAGFEVRDVHYTHYGRICPIETPEGPNIGLIVSLSTYARINEFGFIETPYRKVVKGRVTEEIVYLSADEEEQYYLAQANEPVDENGYFVNPRIPVRYRGDFHIVPRELVHFMDVSPKQLVSVSAALIPFLEHDDANRALMGSNMQRQAVPLIYPEAPLVGTGIEGKVARDSGEVIIAETDGVVEYVSSEKIIIAAEPESQNLKDKKYYPPRKFVYYLKKFVRTNQSTTINQKPLVSKGDRVKKGQIIADGACTKNGELALGRNVLVAFMPWRGYNFEDAILISEKLLKDDIFTSIHIEEFEIEARDTKLGREEITRDIPNISEDALKNLDKNGVVRIGAEVKAGDILVGKITPKSETELTTEEKLLRAIFGEKASDVFDTSLRLPPGNQGIVIDTKIFSRKETHSERKKEEKKLIAELKSKCDSEIRKIQNATIERIANLFESEINSPLRIDLENGKKDTFFYIPHKTKIDRDFVNRLKEALKAGVLAKILSPRILSILRENIEYEESEISRIENETKKQIEQITSGDELPLGVSKLVKVYVAKKRKLTVGDKLAGRHGNKGVVAKILPEEDMPFLADGTPVDIVLNPLGVPSRMNLGQILETHLAWAAKKLGLYVASPVFDGAKEQEIKQLLKKANLPESGKVTLYDGLTGEPFHEKVTVGYIYLMKLAHLVEDKIHARAVGPYSLITQQPLGGKAQFGGQRLGEMEVWALEAYGAAYTLQEFLTVKSDDVIGRAKIYENIIKGRNIFSPGVPESFNVLVKELQSLALNIELIFRKEENSDFIQKMEHKKEKKIPLEGKQKLRV